MRTADEIAADADPRSAFSNHSEYEHWAGGGKGCYDCAHQDDFDVDKFCPVLTVALLGNWPKELTRHYVRFGAPIPGTTRVEVSETTADDPDGCAFVDACTEFEERRRPGDDPPPEPPPTPELPGQIDMFEVFADQIADRAAEVVPA